MNRLMRFLLLLTAAALALGMAACANKHKETADPDQTTGEVAFDSTDINGSAFGMRDLSGSKVVMINFWEAWCGPCVSELPHLQELYERYKDRGFAIVGVYSDSPEADVASLAQELGITYPLVRGTASLERFKTGYVPTTIFCTGSGDLISGAPYVGARSYSEWESILNAFLNDRQ